MKNAIFFLTIALFFATACQKASNDGGFSAPENIESEQGMPPTAEPPTQDADFTDQTQPEPVPAPPQDKPPLPVAKDQKQTPVPRQVIKTANYRIRVDDVNKSSQKAEQLAGRYGGYVSESALTNSNYEITNALTIRVPALHFDSLLNALGGEALFTQYKRITSQDVTEEYVDITTRLRTKKEVRDRYVEILRSKAKTVEDVLRAEEQIRIIQEEIEAKEGRLRFLKDQVALSTIHLELYQEIEYRPEPDVFQRSFGSKIVSGLKNGWDMLLGMVVFLANVWPFLLTGLLIWWRWRWIVGKLRRGKNA